MTRIGPVTVLGGGRMGAAIALTVLAAGADTQVFDPQSATREALPGRIGALASEAGLALLGTLTTHDDPIDAASGAEVVFEAAPEDLGLKQELLGAVSTAHRDVLLCTNTSVISISEIGTTITQPKRFVGTHWWNPAHLIRVVEVAPGVQTSAATVERAVAHLEAIGKVPVRLARDAPGFVGNRLQVAMWREALEVLEQGICDMSTLDLIVREAFGARLAAVGPCANMQLIGLGLTESIMRYLLPHLSNRPQPPALTPDGALGVLPPASPSGRERIEHDLVSHLIARGKE